MFESDTGWAKDVGADKLKLQKLPMPFLTDRLELVKFVKEIIKKNKSFLEEVEALQKTVSNKNGAPKSVKKEATELQGSVLSSDCWLKSWQSPRSR